MRHSIVFSGALIIILIASGSARADSEQDEAQTSCNTSAANFEIRPFLFGTYSTSTEPGFTRVDQSSLVGCRLKNANIKAEIAVVSGGQYHCSGGGYSTLKSLHVNGKELLAEDIEIGTARAECDSASSGVFTRLNRINLLVTSKAATLNICMDRGPTRGPSVETCTSKEFDLSSNQSHRAARGQGAGPP